MANELKLRGINEDYIITTIKVRFMKWYGEYETAICIDGDTNWKIVKAYDTEEEAIRGHKDFMSMSLYDLDHLESIPML